MKWVLLTILLVGNILFSTYAILPTLITLPQVPPRDITYQVGNEDSIKNALIQASNVGMKYGRDYFGSGSYQLIGLVAVNFILLVIVVASNNVSVNKNDS